MILFEKKFHGSSFTSQESKTSYEIINIFADKVLVVKSTKEASLFLAPPMPWHRKGSYFDYRTLKSEI
jgi:hypothetical protein